MLILLSMLVYGTQLFLIYYLVRRYAPVRWLYQPWRWQDWAWGLGVGLLVWLIANGAMAYRLPDGFSSPAPSRSFARFWPVFLFNSIPGALIEEYLFRFIPVRFAESQGLSRWQMMGLFFTVLVFFTAIHIPAYLWQYNNTLWALWSPFSMGAAYLFVYYATRNLAFTTLFHAFYNNHWMLFGTSTQDYSLVILAGVLWFVIRKRNALLPGY